MVSEVLAGPLLKFTRVYLDDIIIFSDCVEKHLVHLRMVFERLRLHNLRISAEKCQLFTANLDYLGIRLIDGGVAPQEKHLKQIETFKILHNRKTLQSFLGTVNWVREHVPNISQLTAPLNELLKVPKFKWTTEAQQAFLNTKKAVASAKTLSIPEPGLPFVPLTDASSVGMAAVLFQKRDNKKFIISYASAKSKPAEKRYHINEQECLALVWAISRYRQYLDTSSFIVRTDSRALTWLSKFKDTRAKLARWSLQLQEYNFTLEHVAGKDNQLPDLLSRSPDFDTSYSPEPDDERLVPPVCQTNSVSLQVNECNVITLFDTVAKAQTRDANIRHTIRQLKLADNEKNPAPSQVRLKRRFTTYDGFLWKRREWGDQLVVPGNLIDKVIYTYHDASDTAHPGITGTYKSIKELYFWAQMYDQIRKSVKRCRTCGSAKSRQA